MRSVEELVKSAERAYSEALRLLERGDVYDAAEKAWKAVEDMRKAFLVAVGVPYDKAKTISIGYTIFSKLLRLIGAKGLLKDYAFFESTLHSHGFYERETPPDEVEEVVKSDVRRWLDEMKRLIRRVSGVRVTEAVEVLSKALKLREEILRASDEYIRLREQFANILSKAVKSITVS